jgi:NADH:ubiquinone oxidoreductase subunit 4 (subunit M)
LKSPKELTLPLFGLIVNLGFYSLDKYILPLVDILSPTFRLVMIFIFCFGIAYNCIQLLQNKEKKINLFILRLFFIHLNFCAMGFFSMKMGEHSSLLICLSLNFLTFFTLLSFISKNSILGPFKFMYQPQLSLNKKVKNTIFLFLIFSYVGAPFFGFFNSEFVILYELFKLNTYLGLIIVFLMIIPMIKCLEDLFISRGDSNINSNLHLDLFNFKLLPVVALLIMNLIMGFNPNLVFNFLKMRLF